MKKNNIPILILSSIKDQIIGLDYKNKKIVHLETELELKKYNVYVINFLKIHSKEGNFTYREIELVDSQPIGKYNIDAFVIKMERLYYDPSSKFNEIIDYNIYKNSFHLVRFSGTQLRKFNGKYTLKMGRKFVNVLNFNNLEKLENYHYKGYALIKKIYLKNKKFDIYNAVALFGRFAKEESNDALDSNESTENNSNDTENNMNDYYVEELESHEYADDYEPPVGHFDYNIYENELDYEPNLDDENGYEANMLYNDYVINSNKREYYDVLEEMETNDKKAISLEEYNKMMCDEQNRTMEKRAQFEKEYYEEEKRKVNFIKAYELIKYNPKNNKKIFKNLKGSAMIQEKMKEISFNEIIGKIVYFINFTDYKKNELFYKVENIENKEFAVNYETVNTLLDYSKKFIDATLIKNIFDFKYKNNENFYYIGKNGLDDQEISQYSINSTIDSAIDIDIIF